ncbi:MAG: PEP-CTERM sorting domain-containing protein [Opitutales bacterium]
MRTLLYSATACLLTHASYALIIDDFSSAITGGPLETTPVSGLDSAFDSSPGGVLFDERDWALIEPTGTPGLAVSSLEVNTVIEGLSFFNDPDVSSSAFEVNYFSSEGIDLTADGLNSIFEVEIFFSDIAPPQSAEIEIFAEDGTGTVGSASVLFDVAGTYSVAFAAFDGPVDFTDVTAVGFTVFAEDVDAPDVVIDEFRTAVPEPATYAALFGILALAVVRLRRSARRACA